MRVPFERFAGWVERYDAAHPGTRWQVDAEAARAQSPDGSTVLVDVPLPPLDEATLPGLMAHLAQPRSFGVVLARKGGFAVALLSGPNVVESKVGRRHVQGRSKAGGWSQQRFARRRDNQAQAAYEATAEHVHRILVHGGRSRVELLGTGGDRTAIASVLAAPELRALASVPTRWLGGVPDPTRAVLDGAIVDVRSVDITLTDP